MEARIAVDRETSREKQLDYLKTDGKDELETFQTKLQDYNDALLEFIMRVESYLRRTEQIKALNSTMYVQRI